MKNHLIKLEEEAISVIRDTYADSENLVKNVDFKTKIFFNLFFL